MTGLSVWERMGAVGSDKLASDDPVVNALTLAEKALLSSTPNHPHYAEAHVLHQAALTAVQTVLRLKGG